MHTLILIVPMTGRTLGLTGIAPLGGGGLLCAIPPGFFLPYRTRLLRFVAAPSSAATTATTAAIRMLPWRDTNRKRCWEIHILLEFGAV